MYSTLFPVKGNNIVSKVKFVEEYSFTETKGGFTTVVHYTPTRRAGNVYINPTQYFAMVPLYVWEFYDGGSKPVQQWLHQRKGRKLSAAAIREFRQLVEKLMESDPGKQDV